MIIFKYFLNTGISFKLDHLFNFIVFFLDYKTIHHRTLHRDALYDLTYNNDQLRMSTVNNHVDSSGVMVIAAVFG
jgi:hypothetical protein